MAVFHPRTRFDSFLEGALDQTTHRRVAEHLDRCPMCQDEVDQRHRILRAAEQGAEARSIPPQLLPPPSSSTVLGERPGVPGWKVVLSLGAAGVAAGAVVLAAWVAGEPQQSAAPTEPPAIQPVPEVQVETSRSSAADAAQEEETRTDGASAGPFSAIAATSMDTAASPTARSETAALLDQLRRQGWNVPSLTVAGLMPESVGLREHEDATELVLSLDGSVGSVVLHECRSEDQSLDDSACLSDPALIPPEGAEESALPMGLTSRTQTHEDGSWTAWVQTAQAAYALSSDLPVERADRVMTLVVLSEQARVQSAQLPDSATERLVRGFERLMPWTDDADVAR